MLNKNISAVLLLVCAKSLIRLRATLWYKSLTFVAESRFGVPIHPRPKGTRLSVTSGKPEFAKQRQNDRLGLKGSRVSPGLHSRAVAISDSGFCESSPRLT